MIPSIEDCIKLYLRNLGKDNDDKTRKYTLKQIHNTFRNELPSEEDLKTKLQDLQHVVIEISRDYIPLSYASDGAFTGVLEEAPILASAVLFDANLQNYIQEYANNTILDYAKYDPNCDGLINFPQYYIMAELFRIAGNWQEGYEINPSILDNPIRRNVMQSALILKKKIEEELSKS